VTGTGRPARQVIPPGTLLLRVHGHDRRADDLTGDLSVSERSTTALVEWLRPGTGAPPRPVNMVLSQVRTTTELVLVRLLDRQDVAAAGLPEDVRLPGAWPVWLRDRVPDVVGMVWPARHDLPNPTMALFGDRCPPGSLRVEPGSVLRLDTRSGAAYVNRELAAYRVAVPLPPGLLVFVNYRSADDTRVVDLLDKELCRRFGEFAVFRDDRSLQPGVPFAAELLAKVRECAVLIAVIGERWDRSYDEAGRRLLDRTEDWVRLEITEALRHDVLVVPLLVGTREKLAADALPAGIEQLAGLQFPHLPSTCCAEDVRSVVDRLVRDIPALGGGPPPFDDA
jgi:hypothetical protein